jgi:hypothetical protein
MNKLHAHISEADRPPVTWLITGVSSLVEKTNRAVQNFFSERSCALCVSQGVIRPFSNDFQFFRGKSPNDLIDPCVWSASFPKF